MDMELHYYESFLFLKEKKNNCRYSISAPAYIPHIRPIQGISSGKIYLKLPILPNQYY